MDLARRTTARADSRTAEPEVWASAYPPLMGGLPPALPLPAADTLRSRESLAQAIERSVLPRLVAANRNAIPLLPAAVLSPLVAAHHVEELAELVMRQEAGVALAFVQSLRAQGLALPQLYLDLLGPTARRLGEFWLDDVYDFAQVTLGTWRLHEVVHSYSGAFVGIAPRHAAVRSALLLPVPGEQHSFGLLMVSEFLRRAGWSVRLGQAVTRTALAGLVRGEHFTIVGFSLGSVDRLETLAASIRVVRRSSRNRATAVMVGGALFLDDPALVAAVGADETARDGAQAVLAADALATAAEGAAMRRP